MIIQKSSVSDLSTHMKLYRQAIAFQHALGNVNWIGFEDDAVLQEIKAEQQYKILVGGQVACVFLLATSDPLLWQEKNEQPAIYIHRIATNPDFRGQHFVIKIVSFVKSLARREGKKYIRMDTTAGNERLNRYYEHCGFSIVNTIVIHEAIDMPAHYQNNSFTLFEMSVE